MTPLLALLWASPTSAQTPSLSCKSHPLSPNWPSPSAWSTLNTTLSGRLLSPTPPGAPCHPSYPSVFSPSTCPALQTAWFTEAFHSSDPVSSYWPNFNNDSCLPDPRAPCSGRGFPAYVINATSAGDVKAGVDFARQYGVRLIVKNSGHDFVGRSSAPGALSIWVHYLRGMEEFKGGYELRGGGCKGRERVEGHVVRLGAGMQMLDVYRETGRMGRTVVGGNGRTVALGGFITGGGHSILAPRWGMAADRVVEVEVVRPDGEVVVVNECEGSELFWAVRGGGGSTFGVLTSISLLTIPSPAVTTLTFQFATTASNPSAFRAIASFVSAFPALADAGVSGYPIIFNSVPSTSDPSRLVSGVIGKLIMTDAPSNSTILGHLNPLFNSINTTYPGQFEFYTDVTSHSTFAAWYEENFDPSPVGYGSVMSSRLLDKEALTGNVTALQTALERFSAGGQATVYIVSGRGVFEAKPRGGGTAVNPGWRRAYVHATTSVTFPSLDRAARDAAVKKSNAYADGLRELAPGMGAYVNEASKYEPGNWQKTFWGDNYDRLLKLKRELDPNDVFWCQPCVGNERWQEVDDLLCRV
ncbi:FAD binding domain-containing protein [Cercophora newfieldiana]|uniref:FAD binding domain-containing protein n=1 Tax=Cercophora newfieldiana TaxID=92897 RepID=A0AA39Y232_9PEZI|nr:FAD binding domain-containing protein [Cercophora newfieldiana]